MIFSTKVKAGIMKISWLLESLNLKGKLTSNHWVFQLCNTDKLFGVRNIFHKSPKCLFSEENWPKFFSPKVPRSLDFNEAWPNQSDPIRRRANQNCLRLLWRFEKVAKRKSSRALKIKPFLGKKLARFINNNLPPPPKKKIKPNLSELFFVTISARQNGPQHKKFTLSIRDCEKFGTFNFTSRFEEP